MSTSKKPWLRWYRDTSTDAKFRIIHKLASDYAWPERADRDEMVVSISEVVATWAVLLECVTDDNGTSVAPLHFVTYLDTILDYGAKKADAILKAMCDIELIAPKDDKTFVVKKWHLRQHLDVTNSDRQARYRNRQKERERNGKVTPTEREAERDTEKRKKRESADAPYAYRGQFVRVAEKDFPALQKLAPTFKRDQIIDVLAKCESYYEGMPKRNRNMWFIAQDWVKKDHERSTVGNKRATKKQDDAVKATYAEMGYKIDG